MRFDKKALERTLSAVRQQVLDLRTADGHWEGELSSSALSTATAVFALAVAGKNAHRQLIRRGLDWLAENQNHDGGWGDTVLSTSNISTTALCWSAFAAVDRVCTKHADAITGAERWLAHAAGGLEPRQLVTAIVDRYGSDRSFSVPILTMCALAGRLGPPEQAWRHVPALPFELAACPHRWFKWLRMSVVSYALPALIAVGQVRYHHRPAINPVTRVTRRLARRRTLNILKDIQPDSGGFLEAVPLTGFVVMSLAASGRGDHVVTSKGLEFLARSVRDDGSWPIDTNLATWVTTLTVNALAMNQRFDELLNLDQRRKLMEWLLSQQHREEHSYTHAAPGGWAWTDSSGGVPDADDTAGALLALRNLGSIDARITAAATAAVNWLLNLQNRDGGIPTFCRGWGTLPFDRSCPDLTAHAVLAWLAWIEDLPVTLSSRVRKAIYQAVEYLMRTQRDDGAWSPRWFGNQYAPAQENLTYGTTRVLAALQELNARAFSDVESLLAKAVGWLLAAQNTDGGWGGAPGGPSSIEETALAVNALAGMVSDPNSRRSAAFWDSVGSAISNGVSWLIERTDEGRVVTASPIGLYFAKLWYFERFYPLIFTVSALERVQESDAVQQLSASTAKNQEQVCLSTEAPPADMPKKAAN